MRGAAAATLVLVGLLTVPLGAHGRGGWYGDRVQGIPPGHLPPPGECRVWYDGRPPGHQPPPTSCREAERVASRDPYARVIYGGNRGARDDGWWDRDDRDRDRGRAIPRQAPYPYPGAIPIPVPIRIQQADIHIPNALRTGEQDTATPVCRSTTATKMGTTKAGRTHAITTRTTPCATAATDLGIMGTTGATGRKRTIRTFIAKVSGPGTTTPIGIRTCSALIVDAAVLAALALLIA